MVYRQDYSFMIRVCHTRPLFNEKDTVHCTVSFLRGEENT